MGLPEKSQICGPFKEFTPRWLTVKLSKWDRTCIRGLTELPLAHGLSWATIQRKNTVGLSTWSPSQSNQKGQHDRSCIGELKVHLTLSLSLSWA